MASDPSILAELLPLEPIFHTEAFGLHAADRNRRMAPGFWEIGASGTPYSRDHILQMDSSHFVDAAIAGWLTSAHALTPLAPDTFLLTYTLQQGERLTRRATIWRRSPSGWIILYHQGTLIPSPQPAQMPLLP